MKTAVKEQIDEEVGEALSDREIERALFKQAVLDDPDIPDDEKPVDDAIEDAKKAEEKPAEGEDKPVKTAVPSVTESETPLPDEVPPELAWLDRLSEEDRQIAKRMLEQQGQTIARLDQRVKSHLGQLQPAQRTITQLQQKLRAAEAARPKEQPASAQAQAAKEAYFARIDKEYEDFPEEATKLKTLYSESLDGVLRSIPAPSAQPTTTVAGPDPQAEVQHLAIAYSDWGERRFSPEFNAWIPKQPPEVQQLLNSPYAADNIALLDRFTNENPDWAPPQSAEDFHSLFQAQHSPLFRGWAEAEGLNLNMNIAVIPDHDRDVILSRFKHDLSTVLQEREQGEQPAPKAGDDKGQKLEARRKQQLQDRAPGSKRLGVKPGEIVDLDTREGKLALYHQMIAEDPDLRK